MIYMVGHRGAAGVLPENTIQGFQYAIDLGVECDVYLSRDRQLVVMHDETLDRTTSGSGPIGALDFAAIRALDAGLELRAWNPDTRREQGAMIALGVTGVSTNRPDILMEYLQTDREI